MTYDLRLRWRLRSPSGLPPTPPEHGNTYPKNCYPCLRTEPLPMSPALHRGRSRWSVGMVRGALTVQEGRATGLSPDRACSAPFLDPLRAPPRHPLTGRQPQTSTQYIE